MILHVSAFAAQLVLGLNTNRGHSSFLGHEGYLPLWQSKPSFSRTCSGSLGVTNLAHNAKRVPKQLLDDPTPNPEQCVANPIGCTPCGRFLGEQRTPAA